MQNYKTIINLDKQDLLQKFNSILNINSVSIAPKWHQTCSEAMDHTCFEEPVLRGDVGEASRRFSLESSTFYDVRDGAWSGPATPHCWKRRWLVLEEQMPVEMELSGRLVATNLRTAKAMVVPAGGRRYVLQIHY